MPAGDRVTDIKFSLPARRSVVQTLIFITTLICLSSCATKPVGDTGHIPPPRPEDVQTASDTRRIIVQATLEALGRPYKWGGNSFDAGFDCSGLAFWAHRKAQITIPRTTSRQLKQGRSVKQQYLQPADLVFFKNPDAGKTLHVGVYIGDGLFVHAPGKGRQVTYADMSSSYFKKHYIGARSYINPDW